MVVAAVSLLTADMVNDSRVVTMTKILSGSHKKMLNGL